MSNISLKRKICVVTGSRAEYGLLYPLLKEIQGRAGLELQLIVTGAHLSPKFGETITEIEDDGFAVSSHVDLQLDEQDTVSVCHAVSNGIRGICSAYEELQPDIVVILGDRYEILAAVQAALFQCIPIAHIHGGEVTAGAFDDAIRHAITKMSHIHFVCAEPYLRRVIQMGENPEHVHHTGALFMDNISHLSFMSRSELEDSLGMRLRDQVFLVTYHPVTLDERESISGLKAMLEAFESFPKATLIITGVNADPGHSKIDSLIQKYASQNVGRVGVFASLGWRRYLSAMKLAQVVVGNSSSGIFDAPAMKTPSVNIGRRQEGRLRCMSIFDCEGKTQDISNAISAALLPTFAKEIADKETPYGDGDAASRMVNVLKSVDLENIIIKNFHDLEFVL